MIGHCPGRVVTYLKVHDRPLPWACGNIFKMLLKLTRLCGIMGSRHAPLLLNFAPYSKDQASASHLDLGRAPCGLYGVKFIDLVSLW